MSIKFPQVIGHLAVSKGHFLEFLLRNQSLKSQAYFSQRVSDARENSSCKRFN
jgi:hypothetical protein